MAPTSAATAGLLAYAAPVNGVVLVDAGATEGVTVAEVGATTTGVLVADVTGKVVTVV